MPLTPEELKSHFLLDPDVAFLNHGSFGACPEPVFAEWQRWQAELERQPIAFIARRQEGLLDDARATLAAYVGVNADDLTFVSNATTGVNIITKSIPLEAGDEVLATNLEYGACDWAWEFYTAKVGATYIKQPITLPVTTPEALVEEFWRGVTPRTKVIYVSHITSATALRLPVELICARAREAGILTVIDGAHAPGQIPLDITALGADIYAGNCHKWLCAPKGAAFLYVHPDHQPWVESTIISWGWHPDNTFISRNQLQGTRDVSPFLTVPTAIAWQREHEWDVVRTSCHELLREYVEKLHEMLGTEPIYANDSWYAQLAAITLPAGDHAGLREQFINHGLEIPLTMHGDRTFVRISVQGYVTRADLDHLVEVLREEFLPSS
ncbi:MAG: aminotransferase class V-fold PLP-dependent enzyme [Thermomicrobiales bacterium]|nr:aminotransferase class V-fold PLP-dependent enzyme [Thermomicrobiales bacterium]MCO5218247.1 aminotransferase class V-fold PLP-dependent enzyme [Thermomicrobiales bacterium]MCO5224937.1 aminotransferase class V-fold PLP-dependent enzyme [Thermomicrobiales bacterium]MCO5227744.1 aminotransferase class V-fold PLP-dependent enzyme [Thermomicrobiales bacterium]